MWAAHPWMSSDATGSWREPILRGEVGSNSVGAGAVANGAEGAGTIEDETSSCSEWQRKSFFLASESLQNLSDKVAIDTPWCKSDRFCLTYTFHAHNLRRFSSGTFMVVSQGVSAIHLLCKAESSAKTCVDAIVAASGMLPAHDALKRRCRLNCVSTLTLLTGQAANTFRKNARPCAESTFCREPAIALYCLEKCVSKQQSTRASQKLRAISDLLEP